MVYSVCRAGIEESHLLAFAVFSFLRNASFEIHVMDEFGREPLDDFSLSALQPWAFQAREFLRKKLIGKEVCFTVEIKTNLGREYGMVYLGRGECIIQLALLSAQENICPSNFLEQL